MVEVQRKQSKKYNLVVYKKGYKMNTIAKIISIQIGKVTTTGDKNSDEFLKKEFTTASYKNPINEEVTVTKLSIVGDSVADTIHHGGVDKAVFANSINNYSIWKDFLQKDELPYGALGENLTFDTIDEVDVYIGDIVKIGTVTLQVSQPRQPCWKISRRWEQNDFMKEIYTSGRTGWYYRIIEEGSFKAGDDVILISRLDNSLNILEANETMRDPKAYPIRAKSLQDMDILASSWKKSLNAKL